MYMIEKLTIMQDSDWCRLKTIVDILINYSSQRSLDASCNKCIQTVIYFTIHIAFICKHFLITNVSWCLAFRFRWLDIRELPMESIGDSFLLLVRKALNPGEPGKYNAMLITHKWAALVARCYQCWRCNWMRKRGDELFQLNYWWTIPIYSKYSECFERYDTI